MKERLFPAAMDYSLNFMIWALRKTMCIKPSLLDLSNFKIVMNLKVTYWRI